MKKKNLIWISRNETQLSVIIGIIAALTIIIVSFIGVSIISTILMRIMSPVLIVSLIIIEVANTKVRKMNEHNRMMYRNNSMKYNE